MKFVTHPAVVAFGLANIYLLALTGPLISSGHDLVYHLTGSASGIFLPVVVYIAALTLLLAGLLALAERVERLRRFLWSSLVLAVPWILLYTVAGFAGRRVPVWAGLLTGALCLSGVAVFTLCGGRIRAGFEAAQPFAATVLGFFALSGALILAELACYGWQARNLNPAPVLHRARTSGLRPRPRIVWIVLDELSFQQVYERRFPGLELPAFDRLAAESTVFTDAAPAGEYTRYVIPSLLTGIPSNDVRVSDAGILMALHDTAQGRWVRFQQHDTVFQDALNAGYSTGVAGWYNPYCRILPAVLDHCYWMYREETPGGLSPWRSAGENLGTPLRTVALDVRHLFGKGLAPDTSEVEDIRMHSADYRDLLAAGDGFLADPSIDFLLLHMPVPHPFGFYDRKRQQFATVHTSYIDNLALADLYLAHVREVLEREGQWDSTAVVVMGDHSWRTSLIWASSESWTEEDRAASQGGRFDDRPAYIVKLPNEHTGARIGSRFAAVRTRGLLDALLQGRVSTPEDLKAWVLKQ